ncbi:hypothetical protein Tco_0697812 [Tanacetum coccineum]
MFNTSLGESTTTISSQLSSQQSQDKGKGILIEPVKPMKKKDLIRLDEEVALKLQAEFDEEERLAREKAKREKSEKEKEANIALIETSDDIQAKMDVDHQLAERLQAQEQEELSIEEKATLFQQLLEKRRKHFATKRAEEKRNKPPTKAQQRKIMCTYLKNMEGYKLKDLKFKEFDYIQEMFDRAFKRVNTFEDFRTELVKGKEKRAGTELIQENAKKQKVEDNKETTVLKQCLEIIPDEEEVTSDVIPLAAKSPSLPKDIYTLMNHYTDAKDIWDNVKMLLEGSELTKDECESQLFTKLINDMRNIKMTMPKMKLNSKFVNKMLPEWGRFVTAVKLNRGLKTSNYDQLSKWQVVVQNVQGRKNSGQRNNARGPVVAGNGGFQNRVGNANPGQAKQIKCYN